MAPANSWYLFETWRSQTGMTQHYTRWLVLVIVVIAIAAFIVWPDSPGIHIGGIQKDFDTRLGLDLVGGVQALLEADLPPESDIDPGSMGAAVGIVENRVNGIGVTEAVVQQAGDRRIVVELPGETDPEAALAVLQQTGLLEFVDFSVIDQNQALNLAGQKITTDYSTSEFGATETISDTEIVFHTVMTGADIKNVAAVTEPMTGQYQVAFELTPEGTEIFADYTSRKSGTILAIILDKEIISMPMINEPIPDGQGVITGDFDYESANALAVQLRYGSLPVPLTIVEVRTVGPTLGQDSLQKSMIAGAIGFSIVILFMALYYRLPGVLADISIIVYAILAFAIFRFIPVTLTLPGIAGFLLSTGSALDANILIFERIKEELRAKKPLIQAVDLGWSRAWPSIRDSNVATLITTAILFWFGSSFGATIVKGFAITLALGVMVSVFTALVVTRVLMQLVLKYFKSTDYEKWFGI
jgi:preprotein translocase subunit SecD